MVDTKTPRFVGVGSPMARDHGLFDESLTVRETIRRATVHKNDEASVMRINS